MTKTCQGRGTRSGAVQVTLLGRMEWHDADALCAHKYALGLPKDKLHFFSEPINNYDYNDEHSTKISSDIGSATPPSSGPPPGSPRAGLAACRGSTTCLRLQHKRLENSLAQGRVAIDRSVVREDIDDGTLVVKVEHGLDG